MFEYIEQDSLSDRFEEYLVGDQPYAVVYAEPSAVAEGDVVAGYEVMAVAPAQHDGHKAVRITLGDTWGTREVGRLVVREDATQDACLHFVKIFDSPEDRDEFIARSQDAPQGYERRLARTLQTGEEIRYQTPLTASPDNETDTDSTVERVDIDVRDGKPVVCVAASNGDIVLFGPDERVLVLVA